MSISVLIAHPYRIFRHGIHALLASSELQLVGEAENGRVALELVARLKPDVALLDAALEDPDCVSTTQSIVQKMPHTRVIVLSINGDHWRASQVLEAGACGVLGKDCEADELVQAVQRVALGRIFLSPGIAESVVEQHVHPGRARSVANLTPRQREVLRLMAQGKCAKEIAAELSISSKTVACHRTDLMEKLQIFNVAGLTKYAVLEGLAVLDV